MDYHLLVSPRAQDLHSRVRHRPAQLTHPPAWLFDPPTAVTTPSSSRSVHARSPSIPTTSRDEIFGEGTTVARRTSRDPLGAVAAQSFHPRMRHRLCRKEEEDGGSFTRNPLPFLCFTRFYFCTVH